MGSFFGRSSGSKLAFGGGGSLAGGPAAAAVDGWEASGLQIRHSLYRSPAPPFVGPRETLTVRAVYRRKADGAVRAMQRSIEYEGVAVTDGYTRAFVECGAYEAVPMPEGGGSHFTYVNIAQLGGHLPQAVVAKTVPERCMQVARVRKCVASN